MRMRRRWRKVGVIAVICLIAAMAIAGAVDYWRACMFERPIFARPSVMVDDGGSGIYEGLGYSVEIRGIFLSPYGNPPGVTHTEFRLFGIRIMSIDKE